MSHEENGGVDGHEHRCDACGEYIDDHLPSIECPNSTVNRTDEGETV